MLSHLAGSQAQDGSDIFTVKDFKEVLIALPRQGTATSVVSLGADPSSEPDYSAFLVPSPSGNAYYSTKSRLNAITDALESEGALEPRSIASVAAQIDVDVEFVKQNATGPRSFHGEDLIPLALMKQIEDSLRKRAKDGFVSVGNFARSSNIAETCVSDLAQKLLKEGSWILKQWVPEGGLEKTYIFHDEVSRRTTEGLKTRFLQASMKHESIKFHKEDLYGLDRESFVEYASPLTAKNDGKLEDMGDGKTIIFTPIVTPQGELANKVGDLLSGQVPWLEFSSLSLQFPAVFDGVPAAKSYFAEHSASGDLIATQNTVVSSRWLSNAGSSPRKSFEELGYADLSDLFKDMPKKVRGEITNQALESISGGSGSKLYENFLVRDELLDDMVEAAKTAAAAQAATQWEHSSRSALTLNSTSLIESLSSKHDVPIEMVNSVYKPCLATGARGSFSTQLSSLESSLMIELAKTWEEVVLEWELRSSSLRSSHLQEPSNESLREQLTEILTSYMLADVIRPKIKTAGPSSLQRSPKAAKAIKDFNLNLPADGEDSAQSMRKLQSATDKLRGQLRISVPTTDELSEARETMLMQMRAQLRDMNTDGPRYLLLTLLLLHAQMEGSMGVLYSTGRCVPRLIRSLRGRVDTEALSLLNACKDQVKAGNDLAMDKKKELGALVDPRFGDSG